MNQAYSNWAVGVPSVLLWIIGATMIALIIRNQYNENQIAQENGNQATETRNKACRGTVKKIAAIIILLGVPWVFHPFFLFIV